MRPQIIRDSFPEESWLGDLCYGILAIQSGPEGCPLVGVCCSSTGQLGDPLALLAEVSGLSAGKLGGQMAPEAMWS